jgi:hypothetical protein
MAKVKLTIAALAAMVVLGLSTVSAQAHTSDVSVASDGWKCQLFTVTSPAKLSVLLQSVLFQIQIHVSDCWNGQVVVWEGTTCDVVQQDHFAIQMTPCSISGYYYQLNVNPPSDPHSAYYAQAAFVISNCFWRLACWSSTTAKLGLYVNMNGQYVIDDGR